MTVAIVERQLFGGTCVNTGCIPTKAMVASAYAAHLARRAAEYGVDVAGGVTVDMARVKARKDDIVRRTRGPASRSRWRARRAARSITATRASSRRTRSASATSA